MGENDFKIFVPFELVKGKEVTGKGGKKSKMCFKGVASTLDRDLDGEVLDPNGFDYSLLLKSGHINWNHQSEKDPLAIIGEPTKASVKDDQFVIEGFLYEESELAKKVYKLQEVLEKSSPTRRLGFSIEGTATERDANDKKYVRKASIYNVAIAPMPKNQSTRMSLVKALEYDVIKSVAEDIILDVMSDGERFLVNKSMDISVIPATAIVVTNEIFNKSVLTIGRHLATGAISDEDKALIKVEMSKFYQILGGTAWCKNN